MSASAKKTPPKAKTGKKWKAPREPVKSVAPRRELLQEEMDQIWRADEAMRISSNLDREQVPHRFR